MKKLVLNKETLRALQDADLAFVVGGGHFQAKRIPAIPITTTGPCCPTGSCVNFERVEQGENQVGL